LNRRDRVRDKDKKLLSREPTRVIDRATAYPDCDQNLCQKHATASSRWCESPRVGFSLRFTLLNRKDPEKQNRGFLTHLEPTFPSQSTPCGPADWSTVDGKLKIAFVADWQGDFTEVPERIQRHSRRENAPPVGEVNLTQKSGLSFPSPTRSSAPPSIAWTLIDNDARSSPPCATGCQRRDCRGNFCDRGGTPLTRRQSAPLASRTRCRMIVPGHTDEFLKDSLSASALDSVCVTRAKCDQHQSPRSLIPTWSKRTIRLQA